MFAAYATSSGRALIDRELHLPKTWTSERERCQAAKIPDERGFATRGELARNIVRRCLTTGLPAAWVTTDEAYGQDWHFRRLLEQLGVGYVVAAPKSQQIKSLAGIWRIDQLIEEAPDDAWQRLSCSDGAKGPRIYHWAAAKLPTNLIFDPDPSIHHRTPRQVAYQGGYDPTYDPAEQYTSGTRNRSTPRSTRTSTRRSPRSRSPFRRRPTPSPSPPIRTAPTSRARAEKGSRGRPPWPPGRPFP